MKKAFVFPGQGSQFPGMGEDLYKNSIIAKTYFDKADDLLGFSISEIMFHGSVDDLKETKVTQPAVFLHSVILSYVLGDKFAPSMVAGHSLGEFSALTAAKALSFEDGLSLVYKRAMAMQKCCENNVGTMAAVLGMEDSKIEQILSNIQEDIVVIANLNSPGQVVISGSKNGIEKAIELLKEAGAKRVIPLIVGGAFHSPLMQDAKIELEKAIEAVKFSMPICPIYQNYTAQSSVDPLLIKENLVNQLVSPVRWTDSVKNMLLDGANSFVELGPGNVLQGLVKKIAGKEIEVLSYNDIA